MSWAEKKINLSDMIWIALKLKSQQIAVLETTAKKDACPKFCYLLEHELLASCTALSLHVSHQMGSSAITPVIRVVIVNGTRSVLLMK